ncbi:MAG: ATP-binding protein, partial [Ardenticatenaceae bacterium]
EFLPQLPENVFVVLAGRNPPALAWRIDPGWQPLIETLSQRNLSEDESRNLLDMRHVPPEQHGIVLEFTHGHPLALALVADVFDQRPDLRFQPDETPDVIKTLLESFVQKVPSPTHRTALEICGLVRLTTEALLSVALDQADTHELFEWLRALSFISSGKEGLFPHDLVREALTADLRWRNPDRYVALHSRARLYYAGRLQQTTGKEQRRVLIDYNYLHRDNPTWKPFFEWQESGGVWTDTLREEDVPALVAMVAEHEGEESAGYAATWLKQQPRSTLVFRDAEPLPAGFMMLLPLHEVPREELMADPATQAAWRYLQTRAPLRAGEKATHFRFWMARRTYQEVSPTQTRVFLNAAQHYLTTPGLAFSFFPCANPAFWAPAFAYMELHRLPEAEYEVSGSRYGAFGHDWRAMPPLAWLDLLAEREVGMMREPAPPPPSSEPLIVLDESTFALAVRDALRDYTRPDLLHHNPLTRSRLVIDQIGAGAGDTERVATLR